MTDKTNNTNSNNNNIKLASAGGGKKKDERITVAQSFICGGVSGVASRTITSPLDVVKILFQVGTKGKTMMFLELTTIQETQQGFTKSFIKIYQKDGIKGFWKGNAIACLRLFPYSAVQFASYSQLKLLLTDPETGKLSPLNASIAGSTAGICATVVTYPMDMVKTRLTADHADKSSSMSKYKGITHCFKTIMKEEGWRAFYKGMSTSILGVIPFAGGTFAAYEFLDSAWGIPKEQMTPMQNFINGCAAAAFAQTFSFPFDTIRKKLQAQNDSIKGELKYNGMIDCFVKTIKTKGVLGLWSGTLANLAKVAPYAGIMFAAYESCRRVCLYSNGYTVSPYRDIPIPGVDQSMTPAQLKEWYKKQQEENIKVTKE